LNDLITNISTFCIIYSEITIIERWILLELITKNFIKFISVVFTGCKEFIEFIYRKSGVWGFFIFPMISFYIYKSLERYSPSLSRLFLVMFIASMLYYLFLLIKSIIVVFIGIKTLEFYNPGNSKEDCKKRAEATIKILGVIYSLILIWVLFFTKANTKINVFLENTFVFVLVLLFCLYILLKYANIITTTLIIYASSIIGLFSLIYVLLFIIKFLEKINTGMIGSIDFVSYIDLKDMTILALYIPKHYPSIITILTIALIVQFMSVFFIPAYFLSKSKLSFRIVSVIFGLATVALLLASTEIKNIFQSIVQTQLNQKEINELSVIIGQLPDAITEGYIQRIINFLFLPYTIGSLLCSLLIEFKEHSYKMKAKEYFYQALSNSQSKCYEKTICAIKKCVYFGGDAYEINVYNTVEFKEYLSKLGYQTKIDDSINKKHVLKKIRDLIIFKVKNCFV